MNNRLIFVALGLARLVAQPIPAQPIPFLSATYQLAAAGTVAGVAATANAITISIFGMELSGGVQAYKVLAQTQLPNAVATLYTVPASTTSFINHISLGNTTGSAVSGIKLFVNGTAAVNQITGTFSVPANGLASLNVAGLQVYDGNGSLISVVQSSFATPNVIFGNVAGPGSALTTIRSDSQLAVFDSSFPLNTFGSPGGGNIGSPGVNSFASRSDHQHASPGGIALSAITSTSGGINTTETNVVSSTIQAASMQIGTSFRIRASGTNTSTAAVAGNFRIRLGTSGTSTDALAAVITPTSATGTGIPFSVEFLVTIRTVGAGGTALGGGVLWNNGVTGVSNAAVVVNQTTATITVDTTVTETIHISFQSAAATDTCTFHNSSIEVVTL